MVIRLSEATDERIEALRRQGFRIIGGTAAGNLVIFARKGGAA